VLRTTVMERDVDRVMGTLLLLYGPILFMRDGEYHYIYHFQGGASNLSEPANMSVAPVGDAFISPA
jgi:hypothetical protein